jgi:hypothetical protein
MIPFLAIHAKKGEKSEPKAKGPHHHQIQKNLSVEYFSIVILLCSKGGESIISKMIFQNPLEH